MSKALISVIAVAPVLIALTSPVAAQSADSATQVVDWRVTQAGPLTGLKSVRILIEGSNDEEKACGIRDEALRLAAARPLLDGSLAVVDDSSSVIARYNSPELYVNVTGLRNSVGADDIGCTANVDVSMRVHTYFTPSYHQDDFLGDLALLAPEPRGGRSVRVAYGTVMLLEGGHILAGARLGFSERVSEGIRQMVNEFVTQIKLANQPQ